MFRSTSKFAARGIYRYHTFLIVGQSNSYGTGATVANSPTSPWVTNFYHDGRHRPAVEPINDSTNSIYGILADASCVPTSSYYSSGFIDTAKRFVGLFIAQKRALLIPDGKGSTMPIRFNLTTDGSIDYVNSYALPSNRYDDATLFGRVNQRRRDGAGQCVSTIICCGYETSGQSPYEARYESDFKNYVEDLRNICGGAQIPVIIVSTAMSSDGAENPGQLAYQLYRIRVHQWKMTYDKLSCPFKSAYAIPNVYNVPLFDMGTADGLHFNRTAIDTMAIRLQYALQAAHLTHPTDYFPRPIAWGNMSSSMAQIVFDRSMAGTAPFDSLFRVFNDTTPAEVTPITPILATTSVSNDTVQITFAAQTSGNAMRITYGQRTKADATVLTNLLKCAGQDLPVPNFELSYTSP